MNNQDLMFDLLKQIQEKQSEHSEILVKVQADLEYHIKRTDLLEEQVNIQRDQIKAVEEPFKIASTTGKLIVKLATLFAAIFGVITGIKTFFHS